MGEDRCTYHCRKFRLNKHRSAHNDKCPVRLWTTPGLVHTIKLSALHTRLQVVIPQMLGTPLRPPLSIELIGSMVDSFQIAGLYGCPLTLKQISAEHALDEG